MPNYLISPKDIYSGIDDNGNPLVGGQLFTYIAGSTTPADTFTNASGNTKNDNPIILDSRGEAPVWLDDTLVYKFVLRQPADEGGGLIRSTDNISANNGGGSVGISFVTHANSDTITLEGLGTAGSPITANALISSITSNALGITSNGGGGLYVTDLSSAIATLSINKLDKVNPAPQSVVSPVTFNDEVISKIGLTLGDNTWIKPESPQASLFLTNGTNPSTTNSTLHLSSNGSLLSGGDGTNQFGNFEQSTTQTDLQRTSGAINIQAGTVSGGSGIALDDQTGVSILATDVSTSNVFGALSLNPAGAQLNNGRGSVLDILPNQTLLSSVGTSGTLIEATNGLLDLKGSTGIKLDDTVTLSSVASETPIKTLGRNSSNEIIEFDNVDASTKLDKVASAPQSVVSEVTFNSGIDVTGTLADSSAIRIPDNSWIRPQTANASLFLTSGTNPSTQNSILELGNDYTILTAGNGVNQIGRVELSTNDIAIRHSVGGLVKDSLILRDQELSLQSSTGRGFYLTPTNLEISNTTSNISLNSTGIKLNGLNGGYEFINVPTDIPSFAYGENSSGELIKYVDGAIATPNLQDVTDEGSITTNGATFGGILKVEGDILLDRRGQGVDSKIIVRADDTNEAFIGAYTNAQGTGKIFAGQSLAFGGGISYNGSSDFIEFFRKRNSIESWIFRVDVDSDSIEFKSNVTVGERIIQGGVADDGSTGILGTSAKLSGMLSANGGECIRIGESSPIDQFMTWYRGSVYTGFILANPTEFRIQAVAGKNLRLSGDTILLKNNSVVEGTLIVDSLPTGTQVGLVGYDSNGKLIQGANVDVSLNRTLTLQAPTSADNITIFRTDVAITAQEVIAVSTGTSPSTTYILRHSTDRSAVGNLLTTSGTTTSTTSGDTATLSDSTIPADSWIWLETSAVSGSNVYLTIDIKYTED